MIEISIKEELSHFKRMLKDYRYNELKIQYYKDLLEQIEYELSGVGGVNFDKIPSSNVYNSGAKPYRWYELLETEADMIRKKEEFEGKNRMMDNALSVLNEEEQKLIRDAYMNYKNFRLCAKAYNYDINYLYQKIDRILLKVFR